MNVWLNVNGLPIVAKVLDNVAEHIEDDTQAMKQIVAYGREQTYEGFELQGRFDPWDPPSEATLKRRERKHVHGTQALIEYGDTKESFSPDGNLFSIMEAGNHLGNWGNSRADFPFHDEGSDHEPMRQVLGHTEEDKERYRQIYLDWITEAVKEK